MYQKRKDASLKVCSKITKRKETKSYNIHASTYIFFLKKKMSDVMKEWRKIVIKSRKRECQSEEKSYLFISESRHALLASDDTYKTKMKQRDDDEKWQKKRELLLNC